MRKEPDRPVQFTRQRPSLTRILERRDSYYIYPLCFFIALVGSLMPVLYPTYLSDLGFSLGEVAATAAPATLIGAVIGATATSALLTRFGYKPTLLVAAFLIVFAVIPIVFYYFLLAGVLISAACFALYHLFDTIEEIVDIRDAKELEPEQPHNPRGEPHVTR